MNEPPATSSYGVSNSLPRAGHLHILSIAHHTDNSSNSSIPQYHYVCPLDAILAAPKPTFLCSVRYA